MNEEELYNLHEGETCLIIGNGPSLRDVPIDFLKKYKSFGTNRIYLLEGFTPEYYVSINPLVIEQSINEINKMDCMKFVREDKKNHIKNSIGLVSSGVPLFSYNPLAYIYEGFTVTFVAMQLAHFMGFDTVLLVGVDHKYKMDGAPNQKTTWEGDDPNHFSPLYFKDTVWHNPDLNNSAKAYVLAKKAFEDDGKRIINLTPNTGENVFEKGSIEEWI